MNEKTYHRHYSSLTRTLEDDMWIIDSGASKNMTRGQVRLSSLNEKKTSYKLELGDKNTYLVKGIGQASIKLKSGNNVHLSNVLYVLVLENNLLSIVTNLLVTTTNLLTSASIFFFCVCACVYQDNKYIRLCVAIRR
jgi:hypothetical protein